MQAQLGGRLGHVAPGPLDHLLDAGHLELLRRLGQRLVVGGDQRGAAARGEDECQVFDLDAVFRGEIGEALHEVSQFADVAGPGVGFQPPAGIRGDLGDSAASPLREVF